MTIEHITTLAASGESETLEFKAPRARGGGGRCLRAHKEGDADEEPSDEQR